MNLAYSFNLDCGDCAGPLEHVTSSTRTGPETSAVARCVDCKQPWYLTVRMERMAKDSKGAEKMRRHRAKAAA